MKKTLKEIEQTILCYQDIHRNKRFSYDSLGRKISYTGARVSQIERFAQKILINEITGCWEWQGTLSHIGYGQFAPISRRRGGKLTSPHRFIFEYLFDSIPEGQEIDHICKNRACSNPNHLRLVSHQENQQYSLLKKSCKHGHPLSGDNLHISSQGKRICKKCRSINVNRSLKKRMETDLEFRQKRLEYIKTRQKLRNVKED